MRCLIVGWKGSSAFRIDGVKMTGPRTALGHSFMFDYLRRTKLGFVVRGHSFLFSFGFLFTYFLCFIFSMHSSWGER
jgi:hypothetical protein